MDRAIKNSKLKIVFLLLILVLPSVVSAEWTIEAVDAPKYLFDSLNNNYNNRAIAIDGLDRPHIAYGQDHLYYTYFDGTQWHYETVDNSSDVGRYASIAIDSSGGVHISYLDSSNYDLKYATNASGSWVISTIDSEGGSWTSIAIDSNDNVHISYSSSGDTDLMYATNTSGLWVTSTIDSVGYVGRYTSIAIDSSNKVHISYFDYTNQDLKYATNASGSWVVSTIDSTGNVGNYNSIAVDSSNKIHISYSDFTNGDLKYANNATGLWVTSTIDGSSSYESSSIAIDSLDKVHIGYTSGYSDLQYATNASGAWVLSIVGSAKSGSVSIVIDSNNNVHISHHVTDNGELQYTANTSGSWVTSSLDSGDDVGYYPSVVIDSNNKLHISYFSSLGWTSGSFKYVTNTSDLWVKSTIVSGVMEGHASMAIDSNNKLYISYRGGSSDLKFATNASGSWVVSTIDNAGSVGEHTSIAVDSNNKVHISYYDRTNQDLKYATNASGSWVVSTIDNTGKVGLWTSITVDSGNKIHISYYDDTNGDLKYATNASGSWVLSIVDNSPGQMGYYTSIAIDSLDKAHISYRGGSALKYATNASGSWVKSTVDSVSSQRTSIAIDSNNKAHISYFLPYSALKYATNASGSWVTSTIDSGYVGNYNSIAIDSSDNIHICYYDSDNYDLKYATNAPANRAPLTPATADSLPDGYTNASTDTSLSWTSSDPEGYTLTYNIYFGVSATPPLVYTGTTATTYNPGTLNYNTTYYWQIVARDNQGVTTTGPVWNFTTINPPSFTKLDASGNDLADEATEWTMVRDNVTGLTWEVKTDDGGIHDKDNTYTWCDTNPATNGGHTGTCGSGTDTEDFIAALNTANYGGHDDWRLPTIKELATIVNSGVYNPSIDTSYFPKTWLSYYWSSTTNAITTYNAWHVDFNRGGVSSNNKSFDYYVRAVRGEMDQENSFVDNNDGTVMDINTGLMWQKETASGTKTWEQAITYCESLSLTGYDDWRLPNRNELQSLVDYSTSYPAIDTTYFPDTVSFIYWSSTNRADVTDYAWYVYFSAGYVNEISKSRDDFYVRAVRSGQSGSFDNLVITQGSAVAVTMSEDSNPLPFSLTLDTVGGSSSAAWSIATQAAHGTASAGGTGLAKAINYIPTANYNGSDSFVVQVSSNSQSYTTTVNVTISPVNDLPNIPALQITNGATVFTATDLSWSSNDPEGGGLTYDIYFGTSPTPALMASNYTGTTYDPGILAYETTYYWKIVARDDQGGTSESTVRSFITADQWSDGLLAYYPFNGNANDESGNNMSGTVYGTDLASDRQGNPASAYLFDGMFDYIDLPDGFSDFTNGLTISLWINTLSFNGIYPHIIDLGNGEDNNNIIVAVPESTGYLEYNVMHQGEGFYLQNATTPEDRVVLNQWQHFVVVESSTGSVVIFRDGSMEAAGTTHVPNNIARVNNYIGKSNWPQDSNFHGLVDDIRIYNRTFSATEVQELYALEGGTVAAPTGLDLAAGDDTGIDTDNITGQTSSLTITGSGKDGYNVTLFDNGTDTGVYGTVIGTTFSIDISLINGVHSITARQDDGAGNVSADSDSLLITVDSVIPAAPTGLDLAAVDDSGVNTDDTTNKATGLTISGAGEDNATVQLYNGGTLIAGATAMVADGSFSRDITLAEGIHTITAVQTDIAGNASPVSTELQITVDSVAPAIPTGLDLADADDTGINNDNITGQTADLTISGAGENGATVQLYNGITEIAGAYTLVAGGTFSIDIALADGTHPIAAKQTDAAGNVSNFSVGLNITVDTSNTPPTGLDLAAGDDTGSSDTDNITNQITGLTIMGTGTSGSTVDLYDNGNSTAIASGTVTGTSFSIDISLAAGSHSITAAQTNSTGNVSAQSEPLVLTVDQGMPVLSISTPANNSDVKPLNEIAGNASDSGSGLASIQVQVSWPLTTTYYLYKVGTFSYDWTNSTDEGLIWLDVNVMDPWSVLMSLSNSVFIDPTSYNARVRATDIAGNIFTTDPITFTYTTPLTTRTINTSTGIGGSITPEGPVTVADGGNQSFSITPDLGSIISEVTLDDGTTQTPLGAISFYSLVNVTKPYTITAGFTSVGTSVITTAANGGGTVSSAGVYTLTNGSDHQVSVSADVGYHIAEVLDNGSPVDIGTVSNNLTSYNYALTNVNIDHTIQVTFAINTYAINASVVGVGGAISPAGTVTVNHGDNKVFTIAPEAGYQINNVTVNGLNEIGALANNTYTFQDVTADHTISIGFTIAYNAAPTTLDFDLSSLTILANGTVSASGKLTRLPDLGFDMADLTVSLEIIPPSGQAWTETTTTDSLGQFNFTDLAGFTEKGVYSFKASFYGTMALYASYSETQTLLVGSQAGYAVIVQGKISNGEGLAPHNKTTRKVYTTMKNRGFTDDNIQFFNYAYHPDPDQNPLGVDDAPSKAAIQQAIETWVPTMMNGSPATLYIVMVDHGNRDKFYLDDEEISPAELNTWLTNMENSLAPVAAAEPRVIIIGACYSGSFIKHIKGAGRTVITSAAEDEESYKGMAMPGDIPSGEFFVDELFVQLGRGMSLFDAFNEGVKQTRKFTNRGGASTNSAFSRFLDDAKQHPLLDDDGLDPLGSNDISEYYGDGQKAKDIYLGAGLSYSTNSSENPADITTVIDTVYLTDTETSYTLWATANDNTQVLNGWIGVRSPAVVLTSAGGTEQLEVNLDRQFLEFNSSTGRWEANYQGFVNPGRYDIFYQVRDVGNVNNPDEIKLVSPIMRSIVYKDQPGNTAPAAFTLASPASGSEQKSVLLFKWNPSADADGLTYNLQVSTADGAQFDANIVFQKNELTTTVAAVSQDAGLQDQTTYYWKVVTVDGYGAKNESPVWSFFTNNTNAFPGFLMGIVFSQLDLSSVAGATITANLGTSISNGQTQDSGFFLMEVPQGDAQLTLAQPGFQDVVISGVTIRPGETTRLNIVMVPNNYTEDNTAPVTTATPPGGYHDGPITVSLACADPGGGSGCAVIYYTVDNSEPTVDSTIYSDLQPIDISCSATLKFFAKDAAGNSEPLKTAIYTLPAEKGDLDDNCEVNLQDAILAIQVMIGTPPGSAIRLEADVNGDMRVGIEEVIYILQDISGLR